MSDYNRYSKFTNDGIIHMVPFIEIIVKPSDKYIVYKQNKDRLDRISNEYYGDPNYGWLILQANPQCGGLEFNIKDGSSIRIPYPLEETIEYYIEEINKYNMLN